MTLRSSVGREEGKVKAQNKGKRFELAQLLESAILSGRIKPGTRLIELQLAKEYSVSQTTIREALQNLERIGLVVKNSNRGSFVIDLRSEDLIHIYQLRRELEPMACALAATCLKQKTLDALEGCIVRMREAVRRRENKTYLSADLSFHRVIWASQPNTYLEKALTTLCLPIFAYELVQRQAGAHMDFDRAIRRHELILALLRTGDPARVAKMMRRMTDRFLRQDLVEITHPGDAQGNGALLPQTRRMDDGEGGSREPFEAAWLEPSET
jgi:DNA-binding GntR family transcriptional regulator